MAAPLSPREMVRTEVTRQILEVAGRHVAAGGAAALSVRSVARDLGMAPSALYRYFPSRDALLSALILGAYEALATAAEEASARAQRTEADDVARWLGVPRAMRGWALGHPHEWALLFGSPVPGYEAPQATVAPYTRLAAAVVRPVVDALAHGRLAPAPAGPVALPALAEAVRPVEAGLLPGVPAPVVARALEAWATLVGIISLELFGHWRNTVLDPGLLFEHAIATLAHQLGLRA